MSKFIGNEERSGNLGRGPDDGSPPLQFPPPRLRSRSRKPSGIAALLDGARQAPMPASIRPQLASLRTSPPESDHWLHEIKYDGYRTLARISPNGTRLITRNGFDWTGYYGRLASDFRGLELQEAILDGEVAVQEPSGVTSLSALERALSSRHTEQLIFFAFDLIHLDGDDLTRVPLIQRKKASELCQRTHLCN
jgi:ATP-dependent DNA ligase